MTTALATLEFSAARTSKAGKVTTRDIVGTLISGNPAERLSAAEYLIDQDWAKGDMKATVANLRRVFSDKTVSAVVRSMNDGIVFVNQHRAEKIAAVDLNFPDKPMVLQVVQALILNAGTAVKGEKAKVITLLNNIATKEAGREAEKLARKAEFDALELAKQSQEPATQE